MAEGHWWISTSECAGCHANLLCVAPSAHANLLCVVPSLRRHDIFSHLLPRVVSVFTCKEGSLLFQAPLFSKATPLTCAFFVGCTRWQRKVLTTATGCFNRGWLMLQSGVVDVSIWGGERLNHYYLTSQSGVVDVSIGGGGCLNRGWWMFQSGAMDASTYSGGCFTLHCQSLCKTKITRSCLCLSERHARP